MSAVIQELIPCFRPMSEDDLEEVLVIEGGAYAFPWSRTIFQDCLRVGYSCWVLEQDDALLAYGVMSVAAGESHILNLCVHPESQGLGFGTTMLNYLLDVARKHKADTAFLEVRPTNEIARRLYLAAGFDEVGMRRNYYPAEYGREDALIMARNLKPMQEN